MFWEGIPTVINCDCAVEVGEEDQLRLGFHVRKSDGPHCGELEVVIEEIGNL